MLTFDPSTTSGKALADLFRTWCKLRGTDSEGEVSGAALVEAVEDMFGALGLDVGGPKVQVDMPSDHSVFTVFGLSCDHSDELYVAGVLPGDHAASVAALGSSEDHFGRYAHTFTAESADDAADHARAGVEEGDAAGVTDRIFV
ncbi:hypothetical protein ACFWRG_34565 [Micromonospora tulbaghiae]|uniref:Uncharacterized protein n=2 Tax=Streptomyces TaxID=1883 RepID=A0A1E7LVC2_9ACTN|nr:hypothetical protein [Streptomyces nanshensis]OEV20170.1 hypothetical protein AN221_13200 [Streptomyces nanshensis]